LRKTFVLVHGAFQGGWCWDVVGGKLRELGHTVYTPTLTGLGERSHLLSCDPSLNTFIEDIVQVLKFEDLRDVILVGHSFSGVVVTGVADRMVDRIRHLVLLDALIIPAGTSIAECAPERAESRYRLAMKTSNGQTVPVPLPQHLELNDENQAAWMASKMTPQPLKPYYDKFELNGPLGNNLPTTYVVSTAPYYPGTRQACQLASTVPGWKQVELATGHFSMTLAPNLVSTLLAEI
jgi:pimeloyl-ACP methyl ester carboxylesterase